MLVSIRYYRGGQEKEMNKSMNATGVVLLKWNNVHKAHIDAAI